MNSLLIKLITMPLVIGVVTLVSRKWGNQIGGLVASMPWIAGPILLFFVIEQGKAFGVQAVPGMLVGVVALVGFCYAYARLAPHFNGVVTLLFAYGVYSAVAVGLHVFALSLFVSYGVAIGSIALGWRYFPVPLAHQPTGGRRLPFDIPIRMVVATLFVICITKLAAFAGPTWSGMVTPFPVITTILAVFTHYLQGSSAVATTLRGFVMGFFGFATFLFLQAFLLPQLSIANSFLIALSINGLINFMVGKLATPPRPVSAAAPGVNLR